MLRVRGQRDGTWRYIYREQIYHQDSKSVGRRFMGIRFLIKEAFIFFIFIPITFQDKDFLELFRPNPSLPVELNEFFSSIQNHKNDFRSIREIAIKSHLHKKNNEKKRLIPQKNLKSLGLDLAPSNDVYPHMYTTGSKNLARNKRKHQKNRSKRKSRYIVPRSQYDMKINYNSRSGLLPNSEEKYPGRFQRKSIVKEILHLNALENDYDDDFEERSQKSTTLVGLIKPDANNAKRKVRSSVNNLKKNKKSILQAKNPRGILILKNPIKIKISPQLLDLNKNENYVQVSDTTPSRIKQSTAAKELNLFKEKSKINYINNKKLNKNLPKKEKKSPEEDTLKILIDTNAKLQNMQNIFPHQENQFDNNSPQFLNRDSPISFSNQDLNPLEQFETPRSDRIITKSEFWEGNNMFSPEAIENLSNKYGEHKYMEPVDQNLNSRFLESALPSFEVNSNLEPLENSVPLKAPGFNNNPNFPDMSSYWTNLEKEQIQKGIQSAHFQSNNNNQNDEKLLLALNIKSNSNKRTTNVPLDKGFEKIDSITLDKLKQNRPLDKSKVATSNIEEMAKINEERMDKLEEMVKINEGRAIKPFGLSKNFLNANVALETVSTSKKTDKLNENLNKEKETEKENDNRENSDDFSLNEKTNNNNNKPSKGNYQEGEPDDTPDSSGDNINNTSRFQINKDFKPFYQENDNDDTGTKDDGNDDNSTQAFLGRFNFIQPKMERKYKKFKFQGDDNDDTDNNGDSNGNNTRKAYNNKLHYQETGNDDTDSSEDNTNNTRKFYNNINYQGTDNDETNTSEDNTNNTRKVYTKTAYNNIKYQDNDNTDNSEDSNNNNNTRKVNNNKIHYQENGNDDTDPSGDNTNNTSKVYYNNINYQRTNNDDTNNSEDDNNNNTGNFYNHKAANGKHHHHFHKGLKKINNQENDENNNSDEDDNNNNLNLIRYNPDNNLERFNMNPHLHQPFHINQNYPNSMNSRLNVLKNPLGQGILPPQIKIHNDNNKQHMKGTSDKLKYSSIILEPQSRENINKNSESTYNQPQQFNRILDSQYNQPQPFYRNPESQYKQPQQFYRNPETQFKQPQQFNREYLEPVREETFGLKGNNMNVPVSPTVKEDEVLNNLARNNYFEEFNMYTEDALISESNKVLSQLPNNLEEDLIFSKNLRRNSQPELINQRKRFILPRMRVYYHKKDNIPEFENMTFPKSASYTVNEGKDAKFNEFKQLALCYTPKKYSMPECRQLEMLNQLEKNRSDVYKPLGVDDKLVLDKLNKHIFIAEPVYQENKKRKAKHTNFQSFISRGLKSLEKRGEGDYKEEDDTAPTPRVQYNIKKISNNKFAHPSVVTEENDEYAAFYEEQDKLLDDNTSEPSVNEKDFITAEPRFAKLAKFGHHGQQIIVKERKPLHKPKYPLPVVKSDSESSTEEGRMWKRYSKSEDENENSDMVNWPNFVLDDKMMKREQLIKRSLDNTSIQPSKVFTRSLAYFLQTGEDNSTEKSTTASVDTGTGSVVQQVIYKTENDSKPIKRAEPYTETPAGDCKFTTILPIISEITECYQPGNTEKKELDIQNGEIAFRIVKQVSDDVKKDEVLNRRFQLNKRNNELLKKELCEQRTPPSFKTAGATIPPQVEEVALAKKLLISVVKILNSLPIPTNSSGFSSILSNPSSTCPKLTSSMYDYLEAMMNTPKIDHSLQKSRDVLDEDCTSDEPQPNFLFENVQPANPMAMEDLKTKMNLLIDLLQKYEKLPEKCKERAAPVKEYIKKHVNILRDIIEESTQSGGEIETNGDVPRDADNEAANVDHILTEINDLPVDAVEEKLESVGLGRKQDNFRPNFDLNEIIVKSNSDQDQHKREAQNFQPSSRYEKLKAAAVKIQKKRERTKRLAQMFGKRKRSVTPGLKSKNKELQEFVKANFESPLVYSLK